MHMVETVLTQPDSQLPKYATEGDAGADLFSTADAQLGPGGWKLVGTGVAVAIPHGYAGFIQPQSSLAYKHGVTVLNSPGLIDSGYRGELKVLLFNTNSQPVKIMKGERVAQLVIQKVESVDFVEVETLTETDRGDAGFGSTGA